MATLGRSIRACGSTIRRRSRQFFTSRPSTTRASCRYLSLPAPHTEPAGASALQAGRGPSGTRLAAGESRRGRPLFRTRRAPWRDAGSRSSSRQARRRARSEGYRPLPWMDVVDEGAIDDRETHIRSSFASRSRPRNARTARGAPAATLARDDALEIAPYRRARSPPPARPPRPARDAVKKPRGCDSQGGQGRSPASSSSAREGLPLVAKSASGKGQRRGGPTAAETGRGRILPEKGSRIAAYPQSRRARKRTDGCVCRRPAPRVSSRASRTGISIRGAWVNVVGRIEALDLTSTSGAAERRSQSVVTSTSWACESISSARSVARSSCSP